jgi:two-component system phosphate regulon sensor histidine kinase PhoR
VSFRAKLLATYLGLTAAVLIVVDLQLNRTFARDLMAALDDTLERQARAAHAWLDDREPPARVAERVAAAAGARVTVIDAGGRVLADSDAAGPLENHADRPEIASARERGVGHATRRSSTLGRDLRYVAVAHEGRVVRIAVATDRAGRLVGRMRARVLAASAVALIVAALLGLLVASRVVRPLRAITDAAGRMSRGDYEAPLPRPSGDELGVLARSFEALRAELRARMGEITAERDRLVGLLDGMTEGVIVVEGDGRVRLANNAAAELLGAPPVGRTLAEAVRQPAARGAIEAALAGRVGDAELERDGRTLWITARPLGTGALAVIHDVTRLRRLESVRRDFVANVSHELRTPVASIQSYAETLADGALADPATARRFVEVIHRNAARLGRLVADLLTLARLEAREPVALEPVALAETAADVAETVRDQAAAAGVRVEVAVPDDLRALGRPDDVERLLLNLVDNAVKYGRRGGRVEVSARPEGGRVAIAVTDDGPGIESRHLPRIFERFYRVDEGRARDDGGTGLGLAIVKHLAESLGGEVAVESEVGKGATFIVWLRRVE